MAYTVFFSWQSDQSRKEGRNFVEKTLEDAVKRISTDSVVEEALRDLEVDRDTKNVPGSPRIFETILSKIDSASAFVADLTFCGTRANGDPSPNPNVLLEYGYSLKALGETRVICVMNTAHGEPRRDNMPFDLLNRRFPMTYYLADGASDLERRASREKLSKELEVALRMIFQDSAGLRSESTSNDFVPGQPKLGRSRFRTMEEPIGIADWANCNVYLEDGPTMWLRLFPEHTARRTWLNLELKEKVLKLAWAWLIDDGSSSSGVCRAADGCACFPSRIADRDGRLRVPSVTFLFQSNEIWTISSFSTHSDFGIIPFEADAFVRSFDACSRLLSELGSLNSCRWIAGIEGVKGWRLQDEEFHKPRSPRCVSEVIEYSGSCKIDQPPSETLRPFFEKVYDLCGRKWR